MGSLQSALKEKEGIISTVLLTTLIEELKQCKKGSEVDTLCALQGVEITKISLRGSCRSSTTTQIPVPRNSYYSIGFGWCVEFSRCTLQVGDHVEYKGKIWIVARNYYSGGNLQCPSDQIIRLFPQKILSEEIEENSNDHRALHVPAFSTSERDVGEDTVKDPQYLDYSDSLPAVKNRNFW